MAGYSGKLGPALTAVYEFNPPLTYEKESRTNRTFIVFCLLDCFNYSIFIIGDWTSKVVRRQYFDQLAKQKNFDPLVPENWYSVTHADIGVCQFEYNKIIDD